MKIYSLGIFLCFVLLAGVCSSCGEQQPNSKLIINEVLIDNESNFQDDYGLHSGWIEIFNKSYTSADLAGWLLKTSCTPGDTVTYFIPKGDVLTNIKPRQHTLFWTDGTPRRGTFHTNFVLDKDKANWIGLYDSGNSLMDQMTVPAGALQTNQSYARTSDAAQEWEVKDDSADKYVTPSTNNRTIDSNPKREKFSRHDPVGVGMAISAMSVVFLGLLLLFLCFNFIGKAAMRARTQHKAKTRAAHPHPQNAPAAAPGEVPGEVMAAIAMALHEAQGAGHDVEETVLTIRPSGPSAWNAKQQMLREVPQRK